MLVVLSKYLCFMLFQNLTANRKNNHYATNNRFQ